MKFATSMEKKMEEKGWIDKINGWLGKDPNALNDEERERKRSKSGVLDETEPIETIYE